MRRGVVVVSILLTGCPSVEDLAELRVDRWTTDHQQPSGGCFAPCQGYENSPSLLSSCPNNLGVSCGFIGGEDQIRIEAYFDEGVPRTTTGGLTVTASLFANGGLLGDFPLAELQRAEEGDASSRYTQMIVPAARLSTPSTLDVELSIDSPDGTFTLFPSPSLQVTIVECPGDPAQPCTVASSLEQVTARVDVPLEIAGERATLFSNLGESHVITLEASGSRRTGEASFMLPVVGQGLTIQGGIGELELRARTLTVGDG